MHKRLFLTSAVAGIALATVPTAMASSDGSGTEGPADDEDIVVTADKRSERLQDVPSSVTALGADRLQAVGAQQLSDYAGYVAGLNFVSQGGTGQGRIVLRGVPPLGETAAVAMYVDETPFGSSNAWAAGSTRVLDLAPYDIDRIEVLRGPQGTLYGANSLGGLIKYVTRLPDTVAFGAEVGGELFATRGAADAGWVLRGAVNVPLATERLAVRASYLLRRSPGFIDNPMLGRRDVNDTDQDSARVALLWTPDANISVKLSALIQKTQGDGVAVVTLDPATGRPFTGDNSLSQRRRLAAPYSQKIQHYAATVDWDFGWADFTSASSYSKANADQTLDQSIAFGPLIPVFCSITPGCAAANGGLPGSGLTPLDFQVDLKRFTQEFRLASPDQGPFLWMAGLFYSDEKALQDQRIGALTAQGTPVALLNPLLTATIPTKYQEYAGFANLTYHFNDRFDISGGLRVGWNEQDFRQIDGGAAAVPAVTPGRSKETVVNYMGNMRWRPSQDLTIYARIASGYRPGGPNLALPGVPPSVKSDSTVNYEVGLKSDLLDGHANFNVSAFLIDWSDIQINLLGPGNITYFANGGEARSKGFEFETEIEPLDGLILGVNGAYTHAKVTAGAVPLGGADGDRMPYVPRFSGAATIRYQTDVADGWKLHFDGGLRRVGASYNTLQSSPTAVRARPHELVDVSTALVGDRWTVRIYAKNLMDTRAYTAPGALRQGGAIVQLNSPVALPRTIGLSVDTRF